MLLRIFAKDFEHCHLCFSVKFRWWKIFANPDSVGTKKVWNLVESSKNSPSGINSDVGSILYYGLPHLTNIFMVMIFLGLKCFRLYRFFYLENFCVRINLKPVAIRHWSLSSGSLSVPLRPEIPFSVTIMGYLLESYRSWMYLKII